eukprot:TRINITY_DN40696_c0_g1_i1.p1 TRINITY_DN40696_c0_g1~~TRINITY_DN40696_c0_g1_i1.p1  ORF type:complete len:222 (+),score=14.74 TRINITY_DN40696_c0_g1_i1:132-797(+)
MERPVLAAVEGGGTSWRVALAYADTPADFIERASFRTTTPEETLGAINRWLLARDFDALGVASFGPIEARRGMPKWGYITQTPKPGWRNTDVLGAITKGCRRKVPIGWDTDVNAPALAEYDLGGGPARGETSCAYITVGTGVGVGLVVNAKPVHGLLHPEGGHIPVHCLSGDHLWPGYSAGGGSPFEGKFTPEGLASSTALTERYLLCKGRVPRTHTVLAS